MGWWGLSQMLAQPPSVTQMTCSHQVTQCMGTVGAQDGKEPRRRGSWEIWCHPLGEALMTVLP